MSDKNKSEKSKITVSKQPDREKRLREMAVDLGKLIVEVFKAQKRSVIAHNDKLCGVRTPTEADKRDVLAATRRHLILSQKRVELEVKLRNVVGIPAMLEDPRKSLG